MRRTLLSNVLFMAAIIAGARALAHRLFGIRMSLWPFPATDLTWVNEPYWWTLAAVLTVAAAIVGRSASKGKGRLDDVRAGEALQPGDVGEYVDQRSLAQPVPESPP